MLKDVMELELENLEVVSNEDELSLLDELSSSACGKNCGGVNA